MKVVDHDVAGWGLRGSEKAGWSARVFTSCSLNGCAGVLLKLELAMRPEGFYGSLGQIYCPVAWILCPRQREVTSNR